MAAVIRAAAYDALPGDVDRGDVKPLLLHDCLYTGRDGSEILVLPDRGFFQVKQQADGHGGICDQGTGGGVGNVAHITRYLPDLAGGVFVDIAAAVKRFADGCG
ncbi:hypothetical protein SDC9_107276 [bioreactor metagenome]|uniref:Uncharacterized protein n=1 Tax=bioreactor metagenome TaxID=1076179 RepID=A0A645B4Q9_9ZZZZ